MNVKEYFKLKPEGFTDKDIFVCESRYSTKSRSFKKIKMWAEEEASAVLVTRSSPVEPKRVMSVFRERIEKHKDELAELDVLENMQERERPDVVLGTEADVTYYCQYNTVCSGLIKTGDYVYVVTEGGRQMIAQVDTIWETKDNKCYFKGPFLIFPSEVASVVTKAFYKQEVLLTTIQDSSPLVGIVGKCSVLYYDDYLKCRPTEIQETDIFVCESLYDDGTRTARKLKTGLKKYDHPKGVTVDEVYTFPRPLGPPPLASSHEIAAAQQTAQQHNFRSTNISMGVDNVDSKPQFTNLLNTALNNQDMDMILENSLDETSMSSPAVPMAMSMASTPSTGQGHTQQTPVSTKKRKGDGKKIVTGYILYSGEVRKALTAANPEYTFGEISRLVGNEWRSLPETAKFSWEERAAKCNKETSARIAEAMMPSEPVNLEFVYECLWEECDFQFEDLSDLTEHCIGHIQQFCVGTGSFPCMWRGCHRMKRGQPPFPNAPRLSRHVRDLHINKGNGRHLPTNEKSKNFKISSKPKANVQAQMLRAGQSVSSVLSPIGGQISPHARNTPSPSGLSGGVGMMGGLQASATTLSGKPALEPVFVAAPPRPQRVQHSEAYIRYIEGLHSEQKYISPWEKSMAPPPANPDPANYNLNKLPGHWLSEEVINGYCSQSEKTTDLPGDQAHGPNKVLKALWALRDFMHRDAMCLHKNL